MTDEAMTLRYATALDNALLAVIGCETFADTFGPDNTPEDMAAYLEGAFGPEKQAAELADPTVRFLIAEREGDVVGFCKLELGPAPAEVRGRQPMEIVRIYARKPYIGQGVGARLMRACLDEAARAGCDRVWLSVWQRNPRAIAFYEKWGFEIAGPATFQLGSDLQHDWLMARSVEV
jgi:ribosomal protein S18 acetylase RimI-like enzyme